jgi:16S rRNA U1498 N3-methylase RsmE
MATGAASIGSTVLRVETAAIVAAARMIMHTE